MKRILIIAALLTTSNAVDDIIIKNRVMADKLKEVLVKLKTSVKPRKKIVLTAKKYLGRKYRFGGFDCSFFTQTVMKKNGRNLPRTATMQSKIGTKVNKRNLKAGDLVFFKQTSKHAYISHVGIMISPTKFIHASSAAKRVVISSINKKYYQKHFYVARRI